MPDLDIPNIGAIIVPEDPRAVLASLVKFLSRPWPLPLAAELEQKHLRHCERRLADHLKRHGFNG